MINRLDIMEKALDPFRKGRGRLAGMAATILATNAEVALTLHQAWTAVNDPRWQGAPYMRFVAQRHAELSSGYITVQTAYDELCSYGVIPKDMRHEQTTADMAEARAEMERAARKATKRPRKKAAAAA
jgi:hypothetical protein